MIDIDFLLHFVCGGIVGWSATAGYAMLRFFAYEKEIKRLNKRLSIEDDGWIHKDRMQTWGREE